MKKIGILTFHYTNNPGSVLQSFALKKTIESLGYSCDVINYQKKGWKTETERRYFASLKKKSSILKCIVAFFLKKLKETPKNHAYKKFMEKYLTPFPKKPVNRNHLSFVSDYDCYVAGSDQIWNFSNSKVDSTYLLDFALNGKKRVSYAASIGSSSLPNHELFAKCLQEFDFISVRENSGLLALKGLTNKKIDVVLDPTLLLENDFWASFSNKLASKKRFVLVYMREKSISLFKAAEKYANENFCEIIEIAGFRSIGKNSKHVFLPNPKEWLAYIQQSEAVFTNSFHGVVFSINFNKLFFVELAKEAQVSTNSRLIDILHTFDLESRIISEQFSSSDYEPIDYNLVNDKLKKLRKDSIIFLRKALE